MSIWEPISTPPTNGHIFRLLKAAGGPSVLGAWQGAETVLTLGGYDGTDEGWFDLSGLPIEEPTHWQSVDKFETLYAAASQLRDAQRLYSAACKSDPSYRARGDLLAALKASEQRLDQVLSLYPATLAALS